MEKQRDQRFKKLKSFSDMINEPESNQNRKVRLSLDEIKALFDEPRFEDLNVQILKNSHLLSLEKFQILYQSFIAWNKNRNKKGTEWNSKQMGYFLTTIFQKMQNLSNLPFQKALIELQKIYSTLNVEVVLKKVQNTFKMPRIKDSRFSSSLSKHLIQRYSMHERQINQKQQSKKQKADKQEHSGLKKIVNLEKRRSYEKLRSESIQKQALLRQIKRNSSKLVERRINNYTHLGQYPLKINDVASKYKLNVEASGKHQSQLNKEIMSIGVKQKKGFLSDPTKLGLIDLKSLAEHRNPKSNKSQKSLNKKKSKKS